MDTTPSHDDVFAALHGHPFIAEPVVAALELLRAELEAMRAGQAPAAAVPTTGELPVPVPADWIAGLGLTPAPV